MKQERKEYRILVVYKKPTATKLTKIATAISTQKDGEISFLNVVISIFFLFIIAITVPWLIPLVIVLIFF